MYFDNDNFCSRPQLLNQICCNTVKLVDYNTTEMELNKTLAPLYINFSKVSDTLSY